MRRREILLGGLAILAGCSILPKVQDPTTLYTLTPKNTFPPDLPSVNWQLVVELPTAAAGIDSSRIALSHDPFTLEYYAKAAWTDNAPGMVQTLLIESFERTGKIVAVGPECRRPQAGLHPENRPQGVPGQLSRRRSSAHGGRAGQRQARCHAAAAHRTRDRYRQERESDRPQVRGRLDGLRRRAWPCAEGDRGLYADDACTHGPERRLS